jgi:hypothetical protein
MSKRWPGGIVTKNQATPTGNFEDSSAPGIWTLSQVAYWVKQALWPTPGNPSPDKFIENLFSTYLYTGNGATQTITNGIDLSGKGGLVWIKDRLTNGSDNYLQDTNRGSTKVINSNNDSAEVTRTNAVTSFNSTGFSLGADSFGNVNANNASLVSWTFRKQPKFFDIVTYTGTGANRTIAHNLGSVPACIMVKQLTSNEWHVYHRGIANTQYLVLNAFNGVATNGTTWNSTTPTSSVFSVGTDTVVNGSGSTYVAYLFAHDAGGFGALGTDNVISCGNYTGNGSATGPIVTLGYEPQWIMIKQATITGGNWQIIDNMRGMPVGTADAALLANTSGIEASTEYLSPTATGFQITSTNAQVNTNTYNYIYIAIRRPMKTPTTGTEVFSPLYRQGNGVQTALSAGFAPDSAWTGQVSNNGSAFRSVVDRLRGVNVSGTGTGLITQVTQNEAGSYANEYVSFDQNGITVSTGSNQLGNASSAFFLSYYFFKRAPGFFDEVCYTGTGANTTQAHNLGVSPELWIVKGRSGATAWQVGSTALANTEYLVLNTTAAKTTGATRWNSTYPTLSVFSLGTATEVNTSAATYVAYLFATVAGVSKVGSYTGTGATQTINAGLASGARFVMIKRTDSTGNWFVWDTARGMVAGTDPRIALNTTDAQSNANWVYTTSSGFQIVTTDASVNASGGTYIYLAIA